MIWTYVIRISLRYVKALSVYILILFHLLPQMPSCITSQTFFPILLPSTLEIMPNASSDLHLGKAPGQCTLLSCKGELSWDVPVVESLEADLSIQPFPAGAASKLKVSYTRQLTLAIGGS